MKKIVWALLSVVAFTQTDLKSQIEAAFLHMDSDGDGVVTKAEIIQSVMSDVDWHKFIEGKVQTVVETIEKMVQQHDKNQNGLDFLEMYTASGGRLQDL